MGKLLSGHFELPTNLLMGTQRVSQPQLDRGQCGRGVGGGEISGGQWTNRDMDGVEGWSLHTALGGVQVGAPAMPIRERGGSPAALLSPGRRVDVVAGGACLTHDTVMSTLTPTWCQHRLQGPGCMEAHPVYMLCSTTDIAARVEGTVGQHEADLKKQPFSLVESGETTRSLMHAIALGSCSGRLQAET